MFYECGPDDDEAMSVADALAAGLEVEWDENGVVSVNKRRRRPQNAVVVEEPLVPTIPTQPPPTVTLFRNRAALCHQRPDAPRAMAWVLGGTPDAVVECMRAALPETTELRLIIFNGGCLVLLSWPPGDAVPDVDDIDRRDWNWEWFLDDELPTHEELLRCCECAFHRGRDFVHVESFGAPRPVGGAGRLLAKVGPVSCEDAHVLVIPDLELWACHTLEAVSALSDRRIRAHYAAKAAAKRAAVDELARAVQEEMDNQAAAQKDGCIKPAAQKGAQEWFCNAPVAQEWFCNAPAAREENCNAPAAQEEIHNAPAAQEEIHNAPAAQEENCNAPAAQEENCNAPAAQEGICNAPAAQKEIGRKPAAQEEFGHEPVAQKGFCNTARKKPRCERTDIIVVDDEPVTKPTGAQNKESQTDESESAPARIVSRKRRPSAHDKEVDGAQQRAERAVVDFQPMARPAAQQPELLERVLAAAPVTPRSPSAFQPFLPEHLWPGVVAAELAEVRRLCARDGWLPVNDDGAPCLPLLADVPLISPEAALFFDDPTHRGVLFHSVAEGSRPDDTVLLAKLRAAPIAPARSTNIDRLPSAAPATKKQKNADDVAEDVKIVVGTVACFAVRLALTIRYKATVLRARFHLSDADLELPWVATLWKAFLVNDEWVMNLVAEKHVADGTVDHPMLGAVRSVCRLLGMERSTSAVNGVSAKQLETYPRTKEDIARLGTVSKAENITADSVNRAVYAALRGWVGSVVNVRRGNASQLIDVTNEWFTVDTLARL